MENISKIVPKRFSEKKAKSKIKKIWEFDQMKHFVGVNESIERLIMCSVLLDTKPG